MCHCRLHEHIPQDVALRLFPDLLYAWSWTLLLQEMKEQQHRPASAADWILMTIKTQLYQTEII